MRTTYKLEPAYNQPDQRQWFITCNNRDMSPYRSDSALRANFWEAFNCAAQNALEFGETSITISWNYRDPQRMHSGKPDRWVSLSSDRKGFTEITFYTYLLERGRHYGGINKPISNASTLRLERLLASKIPRLCILPGSYWITYKF